MSYSISCLLLTKPHRIVSKMQDRFKDIVKLCTLPDAGIKAEAVKNITYFQCGLNGEFKEATVQCAAFCKLISDFTQTQQALSINNEVITERLTDVDIALGIYLTLIVTNCPGGRTYLNLCT